MLSFPVPVQLKIGFQEAEVGTIEINPNEPIEPQMAQMFRRLAEALEEA